MDSLKASLLVGLTYCFVCFGLTYSYNIHISFDDDTYTIVPILACERSDQIYAVACTATGSGGVYKQPKWIGWSNGTEIDISTETTKYSRATDGNQIFYLLITGTELDLTNTGDRYNCYTPLSVPGPDHLRQLQKSAAILKVLPRDHCEDTAEPITSMPTSIIYSTNEVNTEPLMNGENDHRKQNTINKQDGSTPTNRVSCIHPALPVFVAVLVVLAVINLLMLGINLRKRCGKKEVERPPTCV